MSEFLDWRFSAIIESTLWGFFRRHQDAKYEAKMKSISTPRQPEE
jgi:hypothetical protein